VYVGYNRIHGAKQYFHDGGAIYNLSASPGTVIAENYIFDNDGRIGLYLDEGSRYITVRNNVVADPKGTWLNANTISNALPLRVTLDNTATGNWHDGTQVQTICFATADAAEGRAAFKEKRPPVFRKV